MWRSNGERFNVTNVTKILCVMINKLINIMRRSCTAVIDKSDYRTR